MHGVCTRLQCPVRRQTVWSPEHFEKEETALHLIVRENGPTSVVMVRLRVRACVMASLV